MEKSIPRPNTTIDSISPGMSSGRPMRFRVPRVATIAKNGGSMQASVSGPVQEEHGHETRAQARLIRKKATAVSNSSAPMTCAKNSGSKTLADAAYVAIEPPGS